MWRMDSDGNKEGLNVKFYEDSIPMKPVGLTVTEFHDKYRGDYRFLESCHSFIQWLFPNRERGLNYQAPILTKDEIAIMEKSAAILDRVRISFDIMLDFYGMTLISLPTGTLAVRRNPSNWAQRIRNLAWSSHNWLRISRILKFLTDIGMEEEKMAWLRRLRYEVMISQTLKDADNSYSRFWAGTIADEAARKVFLDFPASKVELDQEVEFMTKTVQAGADEEEGQHAVGFDDSSSSLTSASPSRGQSNARSETNEDILGGPTDGIAEGEVAAGEGDEDTTTTTIAQL